MGLPLKKEGGGLHEYHNHELCMVDVENIIIAMSL